jgi:hypothetical protein
MRHLSVILIIAVTVSLSSCKNARDRSLFGKKAKSLEILRSQQDSIRVADSIKRVEIRLREMEDARLDSILQIEKERAAYEARNKYNIIVGSFMTPEFAQDLAEEYRQKGFDTKIIRNTESNFELVVAESYDRYSKAIERLEMYQDTVDIDSWIYVKE